MTDEQRARINAAVAEHVMGLRVSPWSIHPNEKPVAAYAEEGVGVTWRPTVGFAFATDADHVPPEVLLPDNDGDMPGWEAFDGTSWKGVADYAGSWEGMGLVVEKMREHADVFLLSFGEVYTDDCAGRWHASFGAKGEACADTAPLACALAALRAVGHETGGEA